LRRGRIKATNSNFDNKGNDIKKRRYTRQFYFIHSITQLQLHEFFSKYQNINITHFFIIQFCFKESSVVLLKNMVGREEVDSSLESETAEECQKFGTVEQCVVHQVM